MKIKTEDKNQFKSAFEKDHGITLNDTEAELALQNLTDFFALLYQYDLEDKQKEKELKQNLNLL